MSVKIPAVVSGSYINCSNRVAGARSSYNDVIIRATFADDWFSDDSNAKSIIASFTDARGRDTYTVLLMPSMLVEGEDNTYDVPIPAGAKVYEGDLSLVFTGYSQRAYTGNNKYFSGDGSTVTFPKAGDTWSVDDPFFIISVSVGGTYLPATEWSYDYTTGKITFNTAPASGTNNIQVIYKTSATGEILRTANCMLRVLPADFTVVTDDEIDPTIAEQLLAELYYMRDVSDVCRAAQEAAEDARDDAVEAKDDAEAARDVAAEAKDDAVGAKDDAVAAKTAAQTAQGAAEAAQAAAEEAARTATSQDKADKVKNPTAGNLAGLDATGNLTDSGFSTDDIMSALDVFLISSEKTEAQILAMIPAKPGLYAYSTDTRKLFRSNSGGWDDITDSLTVNKILRKGNSLYVANANRFLYEARAVPEAHTHAQSDVDGLTDALAGKAAVSHTHTLSQITDADDKMDKVLSADVGNIPVFKSGGGLDDSNIPSVDVGSIVNEGARIVNLSLMATAAYVESDYPASSHYGEVIFTTDEHKILKASEGVWSDASVSLLNNKNAYIYNGKYYYYDGTTLAGLGYQNAGSYAAAIHTHTMSQVDGLETALDGKANKVTAALDGAVAYFDENGDVADSNILINVLEEDMTRARESAVIVRLALMATEAQVLAASTSDYNNKNAYATDTHKIYVCYQNAWHDATDTLLKAENLYLYGAPNYVYFYDGTTLTEITYFRKISGTANNFAAFNADGSIKDSGKSANDFAAASHTHTLSQITGLPVPTSADAGKMLMVNSQGEYYLSSTPPTPVTTFTISLNGYGADPECCCWLKSDPSTVYSDENGGYMGQVEIASNDALVCHVSNSIEAVTLNGNTQTLVNNECEITPTDDMTLTFNYSGGPSGESVIQIVM